MRDRLSTERLVLRPLRFGDAAALATMGGDWDVARMTGSFPHPFPVISAEFWIMQKLAKQDQGLTYPYSITKRGDDTLIGSLDVFRRETDQDWEIGYSIAKPYWGQGFMFEACQALITEVQNTLKIDRLIAGVFTDNLASIRLLHKLGFRSDETYAEWFSMARMEKAKGVTLSLNLSKARANSRMISTEAMISAVS